MYLQECQTNFCHCLLSNLLGFTQVLQRTSTRSSSGKYVGKGFQALQSALPGLPVALLPPSCQWGWWQLRAQQSTYICQPPPLIVSGMRWSRRLVVAYFSIANCKLLISRCCKIVNEWQWPSHWLCYPMSSQVGEQDTHNCYAERMQWRMPDIGEGLNA